MDPLSKEVLPGAILFVVALALMIFVPALSVNYWQGWLYWLIFSAFTLGASAYFLKHDPALVRRRRSVGATAEKEPAQKVIMAITSVCLVALFVASGVDYGRNGARVSTAIVLIANAGVVLGYGLIFLTLKTNTFAASTIGVEAGQRVVSSGPYAIVRHPMYLGGALMFLATPPALASLWGVVPAVLLVLAMAARLLHEEQILARDLAGYDDYRARVRARLIPGVW